MAVLKADIATTGAARATDWSRAILGSFVRRAVLLVVLLALVFAAVEILPGDAASATSDRGTGADALNRNRRLLGLDQPLYERFWHWMAALPTGDLGTTARGQKVTSVLASPLPNTLVLALTAFVLTAVFAVALGCITAARAGGRTDRIVQSLSTAAFAVPEFVVSVGLLAVFSLWTGWLPAVTIAGPDGSPQSWQMLILPVLALLIPQVGWNTRIVRGALADQDSLPHVNAARLDGLSEWTVMRRHALPGALPAIAAGLATSTGVLLGGAVVVETIFNYPGIGTVLASAVADRDSPLIAGVVICAGGVLSVVLLAADLVRAAVTGPSR